MRQITMITTASSPMGNFVSGRTYKNVPDEIAEAFVNGGYATAMIINPTQVIEKETAIVTPVEVRLTKAQIKAAEKAAKEAEIEAAKNAEIESAINRAKEVDVITPSIDLKPNWGNK